MDDVKRREREAKERAAESQMLDSLYQVCRQLLMGAWCHAMTTNHRYLSHLDLRLRRIENYH